jgi:formyl-CoA transferase|tara:strand:- start:481 stop:1722 length:1242 start_codon:yes stop_codon:yes gene_type:complete
LEKILEKENKDPLLKGLKVIDAASFIAGPSAATIMSDYGAEVIKIEPESGDSLRNLISNGRMPEGPENYCWELTSRNKKSISLNLKDQEAHKILINLVKEADVFITNMPFPVRKKLNITVEDIRPHNPSLIYASLTGYGEVGPDADRTAYDSMAWWARSGLMDFVRPSNSHPVAWSTPGMGDHPTGMALYGAIMTALYKRERTGEGSEVSTSLMANGAWANGVFIQAALMNIEFPERPEPLPRHPFYDFYSTKDNREFALGMINSRIEWPKLISILNRTDWETRELFSFDDPFANADTIRTELSEEFKSRDLNVIDNLLRDSGVTYGVLGRTTDHAHDKQFLETETLVPLEHESFENLMTINSPFRIEEEEKVEFSRAPKVGEHTKEVLKEMGFKDTDLEELKNNKSIFWSDI